MSDKSIFVFGSKIFEERPERDAITTLPLEMAWKIFAYLDDRSLQMAYRTTKTWSRIIYVNRNLRKRLNFFELSIKLGSRRLAKFYRRNKKRNMRKEMRKNYLVCGTKPDHTISKEIKPGIKKQGDVLPFQVKRFKLF